MAGKLSLAEQDLTSDGLPPYHTIDQHVSARRRHRLRRRIFRVVIVACLVYAVYTHWRQSVTLHLDRDARHLSIERLEKDYATCSKLRQVPHDPTAASRDRNARSPSGQPPILIRNATVWTGEPVDQVTEAEARDGKGYAWIQSDVLLDKGVIARVERKIEDKDLPQDCQVVNVMGRQLTAGIVDMHSHAGVDSLPGLRGNADTNELSEDVTPFVRSLDGFNILDHQISVIKSGGVTTSLILPGSGNNIGGEAFVIKHSVGQADGRPELSIESLLADPDRNWRYMKMACGENAKRVYGRLGRDFGPFSRLGEAWYFRHAFEEASKYKQAQDEWCETADRIGPRNMMSHLPSELKWESLAAVLRGQVLVNTHCYTVPDLESFVGYTNEFNFSVRAFHHAHSTYLIPEVLKRAYGRVPAAALFADNMYYKAESYVASEQAGKKLHEAGITPVYVSDNPVINAQHVVFEAAKAYQNGLPYHAALAGVTSASAELLGMGERIGKVKVGFDADIVIWDSDPLSVGSTPLQVFIDGVPQFAHPVNLSKPLTPPLEATRYYRDLHEDATESSSVVFSGVRRILLSETPAGARMLEPAGNNVVVKEGKIVCIGRCVEEVAVVTKDGTVVHLEDGHIAPALTAFGSLLGLEEIAAEQATQDGANSEDSFSAAIDGLSFESKNLRAAHAHGVLRAITAPKFTPADHKGLSVGLRTGATHALEKHAVFADHVALHYTLGLAAKGGKTPSISSAVAALRTKLLGALRTSKGGDNGSESMEVAALAQVVNGTLPLVIDVHSADVIASLLRMKGEIERTSKNELRLIILGGAESHMLADTLAAANVGVILAPLFSYALSWDQRRALTGAPLTNGTAVDVLHSAGVKVGIGVDEDWEARDLFLQAGIVHANSQGKINETEALALASTNIYDMLGLDSKRSVDVEEFVVFEGNPLTIKSQVRAVADGRGPVSVWS